MFSSAVTVNLAGEVSPVTVAALREQLRLRPEGRFDDAWDEILGRRVDAAVGGRIEIVLYRDDLTGPWGFHINVEDTPSTDTLRSVTDEAVAVARAAGLSVTNVSQRG
jgi:hypothetical protein